MRVIGLTGGIATGKSFVGELLRRHGAETIDADRVARDIVRPGQPALADIVARFGNAVLTPEGRLDRDALGKIVFDDPVARRELEAITHPPIRQRMASLIATALETAAPLVVAEIPLLFETGREGDFAGIMLVYCSEPLQRRRLAERDALDDDAITGRIAAQLPIDAKRERATWVIDNGGSRAETAAQVDAWWKQHIDEGGLGAD